MRLMIAGVHSGIGKTTITCGLIKACQRRGLSVQPFKTGPDYIDPSYHTLAAGRPCRNLDSWMVSPERIQSLFSHASAGSDISMIEGVMGLFDGLNYEEESGSSAQIAKLIQTPVILIIDAASAARSAAAMTLGFQLFDPELKVAGVIINRVGSASHGQGVKRSIQQTTGLPVIGWIPQNTALMIPERHLGLVPTFEEGRWLEFIESAADQMDQYLDVDLLLSIASKALPLPASDPFEEFFPVAVKAPGDRPVIAVARDEAFNFIYEDNLDLLQKAGAQIKFFSPLHDTDLPASTAGVILSGGFPELYGPQIEENKRMHQVLQTAHGSCMPMYAECGGLMALTESITDLQGQKHSMFGLLPGISIMTKRLNLGYRRVKVAGDSWFLPRGEILHGHEFHYSIWEKDGSLITPAYELLAMNDGESPQPEGACSGRLWASYIHLHFWDKPELAINFVKSL